MNELREQLSAQQKVKASTAASLENARAAHRNTQIAQSTAHHDRGIGGGPQSSNHHVTMTPSGNIQSHGGMSTWDRSLFHAQVTKQEQL